MVFELMLDLCILKDIGFPADSIAKVAQSELSCGADPPDELGPHGRISITGIADGLVNRIMRHHQSGVSWTAASKSNPNGWRRRLAQAYGDLPALAREVPPLRRPFHGVRWDEDVPTPLMLQSARHAADAGLWVSIHPYLWNLGPGGVPGIDAPAGLRQIIDLAEAVSEMTGHDVPLIFHAGHVHMPPHHVAHAEALDRAQAFFAWAAAETRGDRSAHPVRDATAFRPAGTAAGPHRTHLG